MTRQSKYAAKLARQGRTEEMPDLDRLRARQGADVWAQDEASQAPIPPRGPSGRAVRRRDGRTRR